MPWGMNMNPEDVSFLKIVLLLVVGAGFIGIIVFFVDPSLPSHSFVTGRVVEQLVVQPVRGGSSDLRQYFVVQIDATNWASVYAPADCPFKMNAQVSLMVMTSRTMRNSRYVLAGYVGRK